MNMWKGMNVGIGGGHGDGRDGPFDDEWERRSENFARRMQGTIAPPRRLTTLYHLATMGAQRAWNPTDLSNAYHWLKYELGKTIRPPVHIPKPFGYDAPYNPMDNYDMSVKMENLRILTRLHQEDDHFSKMLMLLLLLIIILLVVMVKVMVMDEEVFHTHQGEQHIIMK